MKTLNSCVVILFLALFSSCGDSATSKLVKELNSSYDKDGQQVELVGYLGVPRSVIVSGEKTTMGFYTVAGQNNNDRLADVRVKFGQEANCFYVPEKYRGQDLEIYDNNGEKHGYLTQIKITGIVKYIHKDWEKAMNEPMDDDKIVPAIKEMRKQSQEKLKKAAEERKAKTGDPNDYSFEIEVENINIP